MTAVDVPRLTRCLWCGEVLIFDPGKGWAHQDGELYRTRVDSAGIRRDDHCATPARS